MRRGSGVREFLVVVGTVVIMMVVILPNTAQSGRDYQRHQKAQEAKAAVQEKAVLEAARLRRQEMKEDYRPTIVWEMMGHDGNGHLILEPDNRPTGRKAFNFHGFWPAASHAVPGDKFRLTVRDELKDKEFYAEQDDGALLFPLLIETKKQGKLRTVADL